VAGSSDASAASLQPPAIRHPSLHLNQLYDLANSIDLERARETLATPSTRVRPVASRGGSIDIPRLPLDVGLGERHLELAGAKLTGTLHARIYDLGILACRLVVPLGDALSWERATELLAAVQSYPATLIELFIRGRDTLLETLGPALVQPNALVHEEDYSILLGEGLRAGAPASTLARHPALLRAALGERRPLSASAASLATPLSYYEDDLILLTWNAAIVIDPDPAARDDATLLLEFANAQLLALRSYDAEIERDLARISPQLARVRAPRWVRLGSSGRFLREIQALVADIANTSGRIENALKVTEDVYWNRVYSAALTVLRVEVWRTGIAEALGVLRQMADLVHDEAEAAWTTLLEILVIALIAVELVVAIVGRGR
jgi:hypothetical protein